MNEIIEQELKKENKIIDNGSYEVKNMYYNQIMVSTPKKEFKYEFPIELAKRTIKVIKLPFNIVLAIGREINKTGKDIVK